LLDHRWVRFAKSVHKNYRPIPVSAQAWKGANNQTEDREVRGSYMPVRSSIIAQFEQVAREKKVQLPPLKDDLHLLESGLDSLSFAIVVARLEDELGIDPFSENEAVEIPVTLIDFIRIYENAAK
jgi:acyl carrier protein